MNDGKVQGAILSIVKDGKVIYCNGYGYAEKKKGIKADGENTAFRIGSVSKYLFLWLLLSLLKMDSLI